MDVSPVRIGERRSADGAGRTSRGFWRFRTRFLMAVKQTRGRILVLQGTVFVLPAQTVLYSHRIVRKRLRSPREVRPAPSADLRRNNS